MRSAAAFSHPVARETPFAKRVERRVLDLIRACGVLQQGERVLVAVSGGPDSTALLLILSRLQGELGLGLTAGHFDHMLRSREEAVADERFVTALASWLDVQVMTGRGDVRRRARREGESTEDAARRLRYRFLAGEAGKAGATAVAVGHTLDDRAETVLLHVLRGSGLDGLAAMPPRAPWPFGKGADVARPLLQLRRHETERYCREAGVEPRLDPTNELPAATRNRVRQALIPLLRKLNPRAEEALARLAEAAGRDVDYMDAVAGGLWQEMARVDGDGVAFERPALESLHPALTARLLRRAVGELLGSAADLEAIHVERMLAALMKRRDRVSLPHGLTAVTDSRRIVIYGGERPPPRRVPAGALTVPGSVQVSGWTITAEVAPRTAFSDKALPWEAFLDADTISGRMLVRARRPGDRLRPLGLGGEKKVQDILVDAKVPAEERDNVPVVCDDAGIVWIAGHCIDERVAVRSGARRVVHLRAIGKD